MQMAIAISKNIENIFSIKYELIFALFLLSIMRSLKQGKSKKITRRKVIFVEKIMGFHIIISNIKSKKKQYKNLAKKS